MNAPKVDDLDAVRSIADALQPFNSEDRERIIRWVRERLGMTHVAAPPAAPLPATPPHVAVHRADSKATDIRSFVTEKDPKSMNELAAVVAYYYAFVAPEAERRTSITKEQLVDACRLAERKRPGAPSQVMVNALHAGLLDRVSEGEYRLNSVGENLVAMVLPYGDGERKRRGNAAAAKSPKRAKKTKTRSRK